MRLLAQVAIKLNVGVGCTKLLSVFQLLDFFT